MFDIGTSSLIIVFLVIAWLAQFALTYFQMKRFNNEIQILRKEGLTSIGMAGSFLKGRIYTVVVVNNEGKITNAKKLSGATVFANLKPVEGLVGIAAEKVLDPSYELPLGKKVRDSFIVAIKEIEKKDKEQNNRTGSSKIY